VTTLYQGLVLLCDISVAIWHYNKDVLQTFINGYCLWYCLQSSHNDTQPCWHCETFTAHDSFVTAKLDELSAIKDC